MKHRAQILDGKPWDWSVCGMKITPETTALDLKAATCCACLRELYCAEVRARLADDRLLRWDAYRSVAQPWLIFFAAIGIVALLMMLVVLAMLLAGSR